MVCLGKIQMSHLTKPEYLRPDPRCAVHISTVTKGCTVLNSTKEIVPKEAAMHQWEVKHFNVTSTELT